LKKKFVLRGCPHNFKNSSFLNFAKTQKRLILFPVTVACEKLMHIFWVNTFKYLGFINERHNFFTLLSTKKIIFRNKKRNCNTRHELRSLGMATLKLRSSCRIQVAIQSAYVVLPNSWFCKKILFQEFTNGSTKNTRNRIRG